MPRKPLDTLPNATHLRQWVGYAFHPTHCLTASAGSGAGPRLGVARSPPATLPSTQASPKAAVNGKMRLFDIETAMQIYYPSLIAIEQQTAQLDHASCRHCQRTQQLVSHGYIRKKQRLADPIAVGKRVFCSNRQRYTGCGRTMQLYLDQTVRYLHYSGAAVVAMVLALIAGATIQQAYQQATHTTTARNAYRWLTRLCAQLTAYRSVTHRAPLPSVGADHAQHPPRVARLQILLPSFTSLIDHFGQPLCAAYQRQLQQSLL